MSLKEVAESSGLSIGSISQIERGLSSPSIRALLNICQALGIEMNQLFEAEFKPEEREKGLVVRRAARSRLEFGAKGLVKELLTPSNSRNMQLMEVVMEPDSGSGSAGDTYSHEGEEAGVVLCGRFDLWVDEVPYRLTEGDSFYFESHRPHRFRNCHSGQTRILWIATPPLY